MPRGNRFQQPGMICHLTHRCHNGDFLFRFARDRSEYRERLRDASRQFGVSLLNYCTTSSHSHEIAIESSIGGISRMMQKVEGEFASSYNRRKNRTGAFWRDRYHCTMIEDGDHLWNGVQYLDLNMVRAGVVRHPGAWQWCGFLEIVGDKNRYRLLDLDRLFELLGVRDVESFRIEYRNRIQRAISEERLKRQSFWTESIAVGSRQFVNDISGSIRSRRRSLRIEETGTGAWAIWETVAEYRVTRRASAA
jgi:putative transposase